MSLVLEALRKQQADTDPGAAVTLAIHAEQQRRQRTWVAVLAVALLLNAAVFAWLFRDTLFGIEIAGAPVAVESGAPVDVGAVAPGAVVASGMPPPTPDMGVRGAPIGVTPNGVAPGGIAQTGIAPTGTVPSQAASAGAPQPPPVALPFDPATGLQAAAPTNAGGIAPSVLPAPEPPPRVLERVDLDSLPPGPRSRFPGIAFSTHVYAEDPTLRAIVVNGDRMQEGDRIGDLLIQEITEQGVILEFESYLVEVPVFTDW